MVEQHDRYCNKALFTRGENCLAIGPNWRARASDTFVTCLGGLGLLIFCPLLVLCLIYGTPDFFRGAVWIMYVVVVVGVLGSLLALAAGILSARSRGRFTFDRAAGVFVAHKDGRVEHYPLADVKRFELASGGTYREDGKGLLGNVTVTYETVCLNVALEGGRLLNMSNHTDEEWTRQTGERLAAFLNVPLEGAFTKV
jgi:hypothetical protein